MQKEVSVHVDSKAADIDPNNFKSVQNTGAAGMAPANLNFFISVETTAFWPVFTF